MSSKIRLALAQRNELFRKALAALLKTKPEFEIIHESANGKELLEQVKRKPADIAIVETHMPVMNGKEALQVMQVRFPEIKIIMLGQEESATHSSAFMAQGASCYLTTACTVETLFRAIEIVSRESYYFDSAVSKALLGTLMGRQPVIPDPDDITFSEREMEVMKAVCDGKTNRQIAQSLHLSCSTIDFYKSKIYSKTRCNNSTSLVKYALKRGLISIS